MKNEIKIKFYGVRGSYPISGNQFNHFGGNTSCLTIQYKKYLMIIDAGTGFINFGKECLDNKFFGPFPLFITHYHYDHIQGFQFFLPTYFAESEFIIYGPTLGSSSAVEAFSKFMTPPLSPILLDETKAKKHFFDFNEDQTVKFSLGSSFPEIELQDSPFLKAKDVDIEVQCLRGSNHPKDGVNIYKIRLGNKTIVHASDTEGYISGDKKLIEFSRGADLLIHDAQYTKERYIDLPLPTQGWGHSTIEMAIDIAKSAKVKTLILTHHDPLNTDGLLFELEKRCRKAFPSSYFSYEGMEFYL